MYLENNVKMGCALFVIATVTGGIYFWNKHTSERINQRVNILEFGEAGIFNQRKEGVLQTETGNVRIFRLNPDSYCGEDLEKLNDRLKDAYENRKVVSVSEYCVFPLQPWNTNSGCFVYEVKHLD